MWRHWKKSRFIVCGDSISVRRSSCGYSGDIHHGLDYREGLRRVRIWSYGQSDSEYPSKAVGGEGVSKKRGGGGRYACSASSPTRPAPRNTPYG
ncbi:MAG: hypothetical protein WCZ43_00600 [Proteiniphilum sp.]